MKKLLISNVVYGEEYAKLFLEQNLKTLLDPENIPLHRDRVEYLLFTDEDTLPILKSHKNFFKLQTLVPLHVSMFEWPPGKVDRYNMRYPLLVHTFRESVKAALSLNANLSAQVGDMIFARGFIGKMLERLDKGYGAVFCIPMRSAAEAMIPELEKDERAQTPERLAELAYTNMHPLWLACHWNTPHFSNIPFTMIWNTGSGLIVRSFAVTPMAFVPTPKMAEIEAVIDVVVPSLCSNPYWASDWTDCPVVGCELLRCFYPPFSHQKADVDRVAAWAHKSLHPSQFHHIRQTFYYPGKNGLFHHPLNVEAEAVVRELESRLLGPSRGVDAGLV